MTISEFNAMQFSVKFYWIALKSSEKATTLLRLPQVLICHDICFIKGSINFFLQLVLYAVYGDIVLLYSVYFAYVGALKCRLEVYTQV